MTAQDVLHALRDLEFDEFLPSVEACLHGMTCPLSLPPTGNLVRCCGVTLRPRHNTGPSILTPVSPLSRAAYKEQEKQKSLENAAKRAVKGGNTGADEPGAPRCVVYCGDTPSEPSAHRYPR